MGLKLVWVSGESCTYGQQTVEEEFCKRDPKQLWLQAVLFIQQALKICVLCMNNVCGVKLYVAFLTLVASNQESGGASGLWKPRYVL